MWSNVSKLGNLGVGYIGFHSIIPVLFHKLFQN